MKNILKSGMGQIGEFVYMWLCWVYLWILELELLKRGLLCCVRN